jgi:hypothetical protein
MRLLQKELIIDDAWVSDIDHLELAQTMFPTMHYSNVLRRSQISPFSIDHSDVSLVQDATTVFLYVLIRHTSFPALEDMILDVPAKNISPPKSTILILPRLSLNFAPKLPIHNRITALATLTGSSVGSSPLEASRSSARQLFCRFVSSLVEEGSYSTFSIM